MPIGREGIDAQLLKTVRARINSIIPISDEVLMSLAGALNLQSLLICTHDPVGDYITTLKTI